MTEAMPYIKVAILGDIKEGEKLINQLKLSSDGLSKITMSFNDIDINVILLIPDPRTRNEQFLELYLMEADIIVLLLSKELFRDIVNGRFAKLWKYPDKHYIIITSYDIDQLTVFNELLKIGLKKLIIKSIRDVNNPRSFYDLVIKIIKERLKKVLISRKRKVLSGSMRFLNSGILFNDKGNESIEREIEDLL